MGQFRDRMDETLRIRGDSTSTRECNVRCVRHFVRHFMRPPDPLTLEHIRQYQLHLTRERHVAWTYFNQVVCALRFFSRAVLTTDWEGRHIPYQKTGRTLPEILSPAAVTALFKATGNLKHRALLLTMYAGGRRASEVTRLRVSDIDRQRRMIRIEPSTGRTDRSVMLSSSLRTVLQEYEHAIHPTAVLFPRRAGGGPFSPRSLHRIFQHARRRARITTHVSPYSLRHATATPLLERGTHLRVIQLLLGHRSLRTPPRYTQVAATYLQATQSPLDRLPDLPRLPPTTR